MAFPADSTITNPRTAVPAKLRDRVWTQPRTGLDGLAYLRHAELVTDGIPHTLDDDFRAIRWLRANASPLDILIEAHRHRVRYVIFGDLERITYGPAAQDLFENNRFFHPVFRYGPLTLYEVR